MLDISPVLLVGSALVFLLVLARLNSCLYKPLLKHMDDRDEKIKNDLENAKGNASDVDSMIDEANKIIADAKKEANSIREKARLEATEVAQAKLAQVKATMDHKYNDFLKELDGEKVALKNSLVEYMPSYEDGIKAKLSTI